MATITPIPPEKRFQDLTGRRFGRLTVLGWAGTAKPNTMWVCRCDCGGEKVVDGSNLAGGRTGSCGCLFIEHLAKSGSADFCARDTKKHPEYKIWGQMISRCCNPKHKSFADYGGRGIEVCDRWRIGENGQHPFACFLADMGSRPSEKHSIDRLDNERGYEPDNCAWRTRFDQMRNRRNSRVIIYRGVEMPFPEACEKAGLSPGIVRYRMKSGMSAERALTQPLREGNYRRKSQ